MSFHSIFKNMNIYIYILLNTAIEMIRNSSSRTREDKPVTQDVMVVKSSQHKRNTSSDPFIGYPIVRSKKYENIADHLESLADN